MKDGFYDRLGGHKLICFIEIPRTRIEPQRGTIKFVNRPVGWFVLTRIVRRHRYASECDFLSMVVRRANMLAL